LASLSVMGRRAAVAFSFWPASALTAYCIVGVYRAVSGVTRSVREFMTFFSKTAARRTDMGLRQAITEQSGCNSAGGAVITTYS